MPPRKVGEVDGFTALKAAQRAAKKPSAPPVPAREVKKEPAEEPKKIGSHIGKTTMPTRHEIVCYECGFFFQITGRPKSTFCPKCKANLTFADHTIETEWTEPLKTAGVITIGPSGIVKDGEMIATDIIIEGRVEGGVLNASRFLEIRPGAGVREESLKSRDLRIAPGAELKLLSATEYRNVEIGGSLNADLKASGFVCVRSGGFFKGNLQGARLQVEEGGGLSGRFSIQPAPRGGQ